MLKRCASPKPVLTTYPLPYDGDAQGATLSQERRATLLCTRAARDDAFGADGMLRFRARLLERQQLTALRGQQFGQFSQSVEVGHISSFLVSSVPFSSFPFSSDSGAT